MSISKWPTMWLPRPIMHRSPMRTTGSVTMIWPGTIPAEMLTWGPTTVSCPTWIHRSPKTAPVGKARQLPWPNAPNRVASRSSGPVAPCRASQFQPAWMAALVHRRWRGVGPRHPSLSARGPTPRHRRWTNAAIHAGWNWLARHGATGPDDRLATRFGAFGHGSCLAFPTGAVFGERWIHVGQDTLVGPHVSISAGMVPGQIMVTDPVVRIGDRCMIGRGSHIVGHFEIDIGDDVHTGPYVYITDQNPGYEDPDEAVHVQWP